MYISIARFHISIAVLAATFSAVVSLLPAYRPTLVSHEGTAFVMAFCAFHWSVGDETGLGGIVGMFQGVSAVVLGAFALHEMLDPVLNTGDRTYAELFNGTVTVGRMTRTSYAGTGDVRTFQAVFFFDLVCVLACAAYSTYLVFFFVFWSWLMNSDQRRKYQDKLTPKERRENPDKPKKGRICQGKWPYRLVSLENVHRIMFVGGVFLFADVLLGLISWGNQRVPLWSMRDGAQAFAVVACYLSCTRDGSPSLRRDAAAVVACALSAFQVYFEVQETFRWCNIPHYEDVARNESVVSPSLFVYGSVADAAAPGAFAGFSVATHLTHYLLFVCLTFSTIPSLLSRAIDGRGGSSTRGGRKGSKGCCARASERLSGKKAND